MLVTKSFYFTLFFNPYLTELSFLLMIKILILANKRERRAEGDSIKCCIKHILTSQFTLCFSKKAHVANAMPTVLLIYTRLRTAAI